jgi:uncharacterized damage-inducible protein DinB
MTLDDLLEAWRVNNVVTLELLDMCPDETLEFKPGKGKTIRSNFVHIHWLRGEYIKEKFPKAPITKLDSKAATREEIREGLVKTEDQMRDVFRRRFEKPVKMNLMTFYTYAVVHEAHHRSQVEIALRLNGAEPKEKMAWYNWWDWAKK